MLKIKTTQATKISNGEIDKHLLMSVGGFRSDEQDGNMFLKKLKEKSAFLSYSTNLTCFKVASKLDSTVKTVIGDKFPIKSYTRVTCSLKPKNLLNSSISGLCKLF